MLRVKARQQHAGEIQIESFSWGASQTGTSEHGGGAGGGKANFNDFHFVMNTTRRHRSFPVL